jgi:NADH dehydrogenase
VDGEAVSLHVLILGGGYSGSAAAGRLTDEASVTIVSHDNFLLFTPMLAEVAAGDVDPRHIITPIRQLAPRARLVQGEIEAIDLAERGARVRPRFDLPVIELQADVLVLSLGSVANTYGVPGVEDHAVYFKTISDALRIRNRMLALMESSSIDPDPIHTQLVVVGAGNAGVEVAAAMADFLRPAAQRYFPEAPKPHVTLVDAVERVTPGLPASLSHAAARALHRRGVELVLGAPVSEVDGRGVVLRGGRRIEAGTVIWAAGVRPHPLIEGLGLSAAGGRLRVDEHLRVAPQVFALGDVAAVPDGYGGVSPTTAQVALRQGRYLGENLAGIVAGRRVPPYAYRSKGELVSIGHRNAVGRVLGIPVSGLPAWFLWRTYYLLRLPGSLRKARVALDWTLDMIFPPDIAWLPSSDLGPNP